MEKENIIIRGVTTAGKDKIQEIPNLVKGFLNIAICMKKVSLTVQTQSTKYRL